MTESEIVGQRYRLKMHLVREVKDKRKKNPDLTFVEWVETTYLELIEDRITIGGRPGLDIDDLIWCWRKATGEV